MQAVPRRSMGWAPARVVTLLSSAGFLMLARLAHPQMANPVEMFAPRSYADCDALQKEWEIRGAWLTKEVLACEKRVSEAICHGDQSCWKRHGFSLNAYYGGRCGYPSLRTDKDGGAQFIDCGPDAERAACAPTRAMEAVARCRSRVEVYQRLRAAPPPVQPANDLPTSRKDREPPTRSTPTVAKAGASSTRAPRRSAPTPDLVSEAGQSTYAAQGTSTSSAPPTTQVGTATRGADRSGFGGVLVEKSQPAPQGADGRESQEALVDPYHSASSKDPGPATSGLVDPYGKKPSAPRDSAPSGLVDPFPASAPAESASPESLADELVDLSGTLYSQAAEDTIKELEAMARQADARALASSVQTPRGKEFLKLAGQARATAATVAAIQRLVNFTPYAIGTAKVALADSAVERREAMEGLAAQFVSEGTGAVLKAVLGVSRGTIVSSILDSTPTAPSWQDEPTTVIRQADRFSLEERQRAYNHMLGLYVKNGAKWSSGAIAEMQEMTAIMYRTRRGH